MSQDDPSFSLQLLYTRHAPAGWMGYQRCLDAAFLTDAPGLSPALPQCYICGPTGLVENAANTLTQKLQLPAATIYTERFGPSGR